MPGIRPERAWSPDTLSGSVNGTGERPDAGRRTTIHIDNHAVIRTFTGFGTFDEYPLSGYEDTWSREVTGVFEKMKRR